MRCVIEAAFSFVVVLTACSSDPASTDITVPPPPPENVTVAVNTSVKFQTMNGWQANAQAGQVVPGFLQWQNEVLDRAADDGINRLRIDVRSGMENTRDGFAELISGAITEAQWRCIRYATVNDNASPTSLNAAGFHFTELDTAMTRVVLPFRQRLQARGESLGIGITYVAFIGQTCAGGQYHHTDPEEYAEFALALMTHLRDRYGVVPDNWEMINEPDNTGGVWSPTLIQNAVMATDRRLKQGGFANVRIIAPSHTNATSALNAAQSLMSSAAAPMVDQIGYHRYGGATDATVQSLGELSRSKGITTAMTEHIASGYEDLIQDVTVGNASTWEQFVLAYPSPDNRGNYYTIQGTTVNISADMKYFRHIFRHVRMGAVRVSATSRTSDIVPMAFRNTNGRVTVVMKYNAAGTITVGGLPAGRYGIGFESAATSDGTLPDVTVGSDGVATIQLQSTGVVALFGRS